MGTKKPSKPDPAAALRERAVGRVGTSYDHARAATINAACSRPRSSTAAGRGAASRPSNGRLPSKGSTGATTVGGSSRSAMYRRLKQKRATTPN